MDSHERNVRAVASRMGLSVDEYQGRRLAGEKWCNACKAWHHVTAFSRDRSRSDGVKPRCMDSDPRRTPGGGERRRPRASAEERAARVAEYIEWCRV